MQPNITDAEMNQSLGNFQDSLSDWHYSEISKKMRQWSVSLWECFIPREWKYRPTSRPDFVFTFKEVHSRWLGHYHCNRNGYGNRFEIGINPGYFHKHSEIQIAAILLHEMFHALEEITDTAPSSVNNYHSSSMRKALDAIGIPCNRWGAAKVESLVVDPSPFLDWAQQNNLNGTRGCFEKDETETVISKQKSRKCWHCKCGTRIYIARSVYFDATCNVCNSVFRQTA